MAEYAAYTGLVDLCRFVHWNRLWIYLWEVTHATQHAPYVSYHKVNIMWFALRCNLMTISNILLCRSTASTKPEQRISYDPSFGTEKTWSATVSFGHPFKSRKEVLVSVSHTFSALLKGSIFTFYGLDASKCSTHGWMIRKFKVLNHKYVSKSKRVSPIWWKFMELAQRLCSHQGDISLWLADWPSPGTEMSSRWLICQSSTIDLSFMCTQANKITRPHHIS